jgi:hypothetical protein
MAQRGRKSLKDEIGILNRYAELAPRYFKFINEMLDENSNKEDRKWAAERLDKAFPKMIPQNLDLTTGGKVIPILSGINVSNYNSNEQDSETQEENQSGAGRDISEQDNLDSTATDKPSPI